MGTRPSEKCLASSRSSVDMGLRPVTLFKFGSRPGFHGLPVGSVRFGDTDTEF